MSSSDRIRVMVVDDHPIMLEGLRHALEASGRFNVVGEARDGEEAVRVAGEVKPEIIVMDVMMPKKDGVDACREVMEILPGTRVLMLTASSKMDAVIESVAAGATGYLQKHTLSGDLVAAVVAVAEGKLQIPEETVKEVFAMMSRDRQDTSRRAYDRLTKLERQTLTQFASGMSYAEIAEAGGKSAVTVRNRLGLIQDKIGVRSKQDLLIWAVRNGFVEDLQVGRES